MPFGCLQRKACKPWPVLGSKRSTHSLKVFGNGVLQHEHLCPERLPTLTVMFVIKRDGRKEPVHFDKITARITKLSYGLNPDFCDPVSAPRKALLSAYSAPAAAAPWCCVWQLSLACRRNSPGVTSHRTIQTGAGQPTPPHAARRYWSRRRSRWASIRA